jgi:hypothetical protein
MRLEDPPAHPQLRLPRPGATRPLCDPLPAPPAERVRWRVALFVLIVLALLLVPLLAKVQP